MSDRDQGEATAAGPPVLILSQDYFVIPKIQDAVWGLGFQPVIVDGPEVLAGEAALEERPIPLTEPLRGAEAAFLRSIVSLHPALIVVDTSAAGLPWARWIQVLKTSAATRRLPILAFGQHLEQDRLTQAQAMGADRVLARGAFLRKPSDWVRDLARQPTPEDLTAACDGDLPAAVRQGIALIEAGDFFKAHEVLEAAVLAEPGPEGVLYRVLLQVAVAYLHTQRGNRRGATKMLLRVRQWLDPLPPHCRGVDLQVLRVNLSDLQHALDAAPLESKAPLDKSLLRPIPLAGGR